MADSPPKQRKLTRQEKREKREKQEAAELADKCLVDVRDASGTEGDNEFRLNISDFGINWGGWDTKLKQTMSAPEVVQTLKTMDFKDWSIRVNVHRLTKTQAQVVLAALVHVPNITELHVCNTPVNMHSMRSICEILRTNPVVELELKQCQIQPPHIQVLMATLKGLKGLKSLDLGGNKFREGWDCVVEWLRTNTTLEHFGCRGGGINDAFLNKILDVYERENWTLKDVYYDSKRKVVLDRYRPVELRDEDGHYKRDKWGMLDHGASPAAHWIRFRKQAIRLFQQGVRLHVLRRWHISLRAADMVLVHPIEYRDYDKYDRLVKGSLVCVAMDKLSTNHRPTVADLNENLRDLIQVYYLQDCRYGSWP